MGLHGEVAERFNATVLKTVERATVPRVRIPPSPPAQVTPPAPGAFSCAWPVHGFEPARAQGSGGALRAERRARGLADSRSEDAESLPLRQSRSRPQHRGLFHVTGGRFCCHILLRFSFGWLRRPPKSHPRRPSVLNPPVWVASAATQIASSPQQFDRRAPPVFPKPCLRVYLSCREMCSR